jgi:hypothetical protein
MVKSKSGEKMSSNKSIVNLKKYSPQFKDHVLER